MNDIEIVSEFRKGIAVGRFKSWSSLSYRSRNNYVLINKKNEVVYRCYGYDDECIYRSLDGRYYITEFERYAPCTYPGQDRDTTWSIRPIIKRVLDEDGNVIVERDQLSNSHKIDKYLKECPLEHIVELGDGLVLHADTTYNITCRKNKKFSPLGNIKELSEKGFASGDVYDHEIADYKFIVNDNNSIKTINGDIICGSSVYDLNTTMFKFELPYKFEPWGKFNNGRLKIGIVSNYRDFVVFVSNKKIEWVGDVDSFSFFIKMFELDFDDFPQADDIEKKCYPEDLPNDYSGKFERLKPKIEYLINGYEPIMPREPFWFIADPDSYCVKRTFDDNYNIMRWKATYQRDCFYNVDGRWLIIPKEEKQKLSDEIFNIECHKPNYIKNISCLAKNLLLCGKTYSIYMFECRPFGYLTKDGVLEYDFDVENIVW